MVGETEEECTDLLWKVSKIAHEWSVKNLLPLNLSKTKILVLQANRNFRSEYSPLILMGGAIIEVIRRCKLLGIIVDEDLSFDAHLTDVIARMESRGRSVLMLMAMRWGPSCLS